MGASGQTSAARLATATGRVSGAGRATLGAGGHAAYLAAVLADTPAGLWVGDDASGSFLDTSGAGLVTSQAIVGGAPSYQATALIPGGPAVATGTFEGLSTPRAVAGGSAPNTFSLELLVQISGTIAAPLFGVGAFARNNCCIYVAAPSSGSAGRRIHFLFGGVGFNDTGTDLADGVLTHIVARRDAAGNNSCIVNGVATALATTTAPSGVEDFTEIGGATTSPANVVCGYRALYTSVLSLAECQAHYAALS